MLFLMKKAINSFDRWTIYDTQYLQRFFEFYEKRRDCVTKKRNIFLENSII